MQEWVEQTDKFLNLNERDVLIGTGNKSHVQMENFVKQEFKKFEKNRHMEDFIKSEKEHVRELEQIVKKIKPDGKE